MPKQSGKMPASRKRAKEWLLTARKSVDRALEEIDKPGPTDVAIYTFAAKDELDEVIKELRRG